MSTHKGLSDFSPGRSQTLLFDGSGVDTGDAQLILNQISRAWNMPMDGSAIMGARYADPSNASGTLGQQMMASSAFGFSKRFDMIRRAYEKKGAPLTSEEFAEIARKPKSDGEPPRYGFREVAPGKFWISQGFKSGDFALGGVNAGMLFDVNTGKAIGLVSDEHDLFKASVPGGRRMINITLPTQKNLYDPKTKYEAQKPPEGVDEAADELAEKYGVDLADAKNMGKFNKMQKVAILIHEKMANEATPELRDYADTTSAALKGAAGITGGLMIEENLMGDDPFEDTTEE